MKTNQTHKQSGLVTDEPCIEGMEKKTGVIPGEKTHG
jgi:hypothetical protein